MNTNSVVAFYSSNLGWIIPYLYQQVESQIIIGVLIAASVIAVLMIYYFFVKPRLEKKRDGEGADSGQPSQYKDVEGAEDSAGAANSGASLEPQIN